MTASFFRSLILSRAMGIEPIARAILPDPCEVDRYGSRAGPDGRWRRVATRDGRRVVSSVVDERDTGSETLHQRSL
jgi:hypothetical protein